MDSYQQSVVNRLKTARGHVNGIITIIERDAYCPEVMKQLSAVQGLLEGRAGSCCAGIWRPAWPRRCSRGRTAKIVDELMKTLKFDKHVFRPPQAPGGDVTEFAPEEVSDG